MKGAPKFARAVQETKGRPRPGTIARVEIRQLRIEGEPYTYKHWAQIDAFVGSGPRGGLEMAERLAEYLNEAWAAFYRDPTITLANHYPRNVPRRHPENE